MKSKIEIQTLPLFPVLEEKLIELLSGLTEEEWQVQTVAKLWKVKDVAAHLLDGNLRGLSISRDGYFGEKAADIHSYQDLVNFLNGLNLSWTSATKRLSPQVLISLLASSGKEYIQHLETLDLYADAIFSVAWAGQKTSPNWFHISREYTEKFLHQQQIRDAVDKPGIMTKDLFYPFLDTMMRAFPYTFREKDAIQGTLVGIEITTEIGGIWVIERKESKWELVWDLNRELASKVTLTPEIAWKLFSKSWRPEEVRHLVSIEGDQNLGKHALTLLGFMA